MMGEEKYTQKVMAAMQTAQQAAALHYHQEITTAHFLLALAKEPEGLLNTIFQECNTDLVMLKTRVEQVLRKIPSVKGQDRLSMNTAMVRVLGKAEKLAEEMKDDYVSTEHILLAIVDDGDRDVVDICREFCLSRSKIKSTIKINRKQNVTSDNPEEGYKSLEKYGVQFELQCVLLDPILDAQKLCGNE